MWWPFNLQNGKKQACCKILEFRNFLFWFINWTGTAGNWHKYLFLWWQIMMPLLKIRLSHGKQKRSPAVRTKLLFQSRCPKKLFLSTKFKNLELSLFAIFEYLLFLPSIWILQSDICKSAYFQTPFAVKICLAKLGEIRNLPLNVWLHSDPQISH